MNAMNIEINNREILEKVSRLAGTVTASTNGGNAIRTAKYNLIKLLRKSRIILKFGT